MCFKLILNVFRRHSLSHIIQKESWSRSACSFHNVKALACPVSRNEQRQKPHGRCIYIIIPTDRSVGQVRQNRKQGIVYILPQGVRVALPLTNSRICEILTLSKPKRSANALMYKIVSAQSLPPRQPLMGRRCKSKEKTLFWQIFCPFFVLLRHYFREC